ncbi:MAG: bifunctional pantoate--beta-alanine ligase/(d)CMP kinase [Phormidesmis sp.]
MRLFNTVTGLRQYLDQSTQDQSTQDQSTQDQSARGQSNQKDSIGLVPTMGALHAGHLSLIKSARLECDRLIVSIFVNPLQFGPSEDLDHYPRPHQADRQLCQTAGVDAIFMPSPKELYGIPQPDLATVTQVMPPKNMTAVLCGRFRPTHFLGVATVVTKLLNIVRPTRAYFGQKDAQQVAIIRRLVQDLNLPGSIVVCPIVREPSGLALSSRNQYLSPAGRQQATVLYRSLQAAQAAFAKGARSASELLQAAHQVLATEPAVNLEYLSLVHPDTLEPLQAVSTLGMMAIAANIEQRTGKTRLIDNLVLDSQTPQGHSPLYRAPVIAIDGPAGAGKSTVARKIAHRLGLLYLDTGAMYRALTWFVLNQNVDPADEAAVARLLDRCQIELIAHAVGDQPEPPQVKVNGREVTQAIRAQAVTNQVSTVAAQPAVRSHLVSQQQQYGIQGGIVADGRDIGTQVFPNAELKIYLTASVEERASRRYRDLASAEQSLPALSELTEAIAQRDYKDSTRAVSPLRKAADAIEIITDDLSAQQVIEKIVGLYQQVTQEVNNER